MASSTFAATFARTLAEAPKELDDNYEGTHGRPVTFAEMPVAFVPPGENTEPLPIKISLRSIRSPKFQLEYSVPRTDTIYAVKERLLSDPEGPLGDAKYAPANIKLLLKSKVITDTRQLLELPSTEFTVMFVTASESIEVPVPAQVYWGAEASVEPVQQRAEQHPNTSRPQPSKRPGINETFWREIEAVARRYVDDPAALIDKFRVAAAAEQSDLD